jgi:6-phosphogluconolactonase
MRRVVVYPDASAVADAAAARLLVTLGDVLATQGQAHVVLTGGTVGIGTLAAVAASPLRDSIDWTSVHVWWGDERFVARGDADRNEGQAQDALLRHVRLPEENIHRMGASDMYASAEQAATAYEDEIVRAGNPEWDVLMLGLGPDAHVASLFPGHPGFDDHHSAVLAVHDSPKPPPTRVSLGRAGLGRARRAWVVAAGDGKADAVRDCLKGDESLPGATVRGSLETVWMVDAAAAARA